MFYLTFEVGFKFPLYNVYSVTVWDIIRQRNLQVCIVLGSPLIQVPLKTSPSPCKFCVKPDGRKINVTKFLFWWLYFIVNCTLFWGIIIYVSHNLWNYKKLMRRCLEPGHLLSLLDLIWRVRPLSHWDPP